ncbi:MAG: Maf family nucleotide pyrophosphatase [Pseudomonadota bacterium]
MNDLILASASPIRSSLLQRSGIPHTVEPARVDEAALKAALLSEGASPRDIADALAEMKARKIAERHTEARVLGADQVLVLKDRLIDKAADLAEARETLLSLRGTRHTLLSAVVIYEGARPVWRHIGKADLTMRPFSDAFLDAYIERHGDALLATVGCYKLEEDGPTLFTSVTGDYFSVLGLPLLEVLAFLRTRRIGET